MRLNSLHNALYVAAKLLHADLIAVKLLPASHVDWSPADIAVGDTSQLQHFSWLDGTTPPEPRDCQKLHQPLFGVPDALSVYTRPDAQSFAVAVSINETVLDALPGQFLAHERRGSARLELGTVWFAITLTDNAPAREHLLAEDGASELVELIFGVCSQSLWTMYRSAMLQLDATTALPGPSELRHQLQLHIAQMTAARSVQTPNGRDHTRTLLVLLELDDFSLLRRQLGNSDADVLLQETAKSLRAAVRKNDGLFRYSDSVFAITADVAEGTATQVLDKVSSAWRVLADNASYAGITTSLGYAIAGSIDDSTDDSTDEALALPSSQQFFLSAEQALASARESGGNQVVAASADLSFDLGKRRQTSGGVFTSDPMKDYRNSRILWHTTSLIAGETNPGIMCRSFITLLQDMLSLEQADILTEVNGELRSSTENAQKILRPQQTLLVRQSLGQRKSQIEKTHSDSSDTDEQVTTAAVPLLSRAQVIGALLLETTNQLDDSDLIFLTAIADQIAGALDRLELADIQERLNAKESASLRAEIKELRDNNNIAAATPIIAASTAMRDVLAYVGKIAPTDASILIMGESGAGKEVMAKAIVAASNRADAPLVTVDCSAIAHSLIDSELFGRVKGAFTGADDASPGRIAEADGGTLFLDEIGELPMDVQGKLLRFVQEKELIAVGDTRRRKIDTRIICATNRDLLQESSQGRFRADLYYRLQVLQVTVPPLRERMADITALANSFAERYSDQFGKTIAGFTDAAWTKINQYTWPGNVRELQNAIVRATLTTETDYIDTDDLQFGEELPAPEQSVFTSEDRARQPQAPLRANYHHSPEPELSGLGRASDHALNNQQEYPAKPGDDWLTLKSLLAGQVTALVAESRLEAPVGRWLADTVVLTAASVSDGVARQAARLLGVPETTLRRQLTKARQNEDNPFQLMSSQWLTSLPALTDLLRTLMQQDQGETEFAERCQVLLLQQVANHIGEDRKAGAALMGITPPTYARWLIRHEIAPQPISNETSETTFKLEQKFS